MADAQAIRDETARELNIDVAELGYIEDDLTEMAEPEDAETFTEADDVEGQLVNSFNCRRPRYEGDFLYFYRDCNGVFGRLRRDRIISIWATGYCGYPVRRYLVRWT